MYKIVFTSEMKRNVKLMQRRGKDIEKLTNVLDLLAKDIPLDEKHKDHQLTGNLKEFRECHIEPDWLLIYKKQNDILILTATATGSHSDLF